MTTRISRRKRTKRCHHSWKATHNEANADILVKKESVERGRQKAFIGRSFMSDRAKKGE